MTDQLRQLITDWCRLDVTSADIILAADCLGIAGGYPHYHLLYRFTLLDLDRIEDIRRGRLTKRYQHFDLMDCYGMCEAFDLSEFSAARQLWKYQVSGEVPPPRPVLRLVK